MSEPQQRNGTESQQKFFAPTNEALLQRLLYTDFQRRIGGDLNEKQKVRLVKTVHHYMKEVSTDDDNAGKSVQFMNKEVLQAVVPDYLSYLRRGGVGQAQEPLDPMKADVSSRFDVMQSARMEGRDAAPATPNFQLTLDDSNAESSLSRFEQLKQQREAEAKRQALEASAGTGAGPAAQQDEDELPEDMMNRIVSDDAFRQQRQAATRNDNQALSLRQQARAAQSDANKNALMEVPPDPRQLLFGEQGFPNSPRGRGMANANPTLALADSFRARAPLPQDNLKAQEDVVSYRENEFNLFVYSADRDWVNNTTENRYDFTVNFNPANNTQGFGLSPSSYIKFKNISRIELVKMIMSTESCDTLSLKTSATAYDTSKFLNVFSYPYLQVRIPELNTNGFGTNDGLNNAFGVVSYDAYWASDSALKNRGYTRMVPKFLKCQKIYHPTPLSTLQKLSIQIQKPDGTTFCTSSDTLDVSGVVTSAQLYNPTGGSPPTAALPLPWLAASGTVNVTGAFYRDAVGEYLWVQTKTWFSQFTVTQGDRIIFKNLAFPSTFTALGSSSTAFLSFLMRPEGHNVVDVAQLTLASTVFSFNDGATGSNKLGYSNFIIIRSNFTDPTTGAVSLVPWGGAGSATFLTALQTNAALASGRLMNMNHQVQLIFRVITRDMDSSTRLRPDNL